MFVRFLDQKTAHKMERMLSEYGLWMEKLRRYLRHHQLGELKSEGRPGCVDRQDLARLRRMKLPREAAKLLDWCWVVDAACRKLQEWETEEDEPGRFTGILREYYGLGMEAYEQDEWIFRGTRERRLHTMQTRHMEQTTFYEMRRQILAAIYTAGVQIGLYHPYPEEEERAAM